MASQGKVLKFQDRAKGQVVDLVHLQHVINLKQMGLTDEQIEIELAKAELQIVDN